MEPKPDSQYHVPEETLRKRALHKIASLLTTEYLMVLAWRLHELDGRGFGWVAIEYRNGHPDIIRRSDSDKPHLMSANEIEMVAQRWDGGCQ